MSIHLPADIAALVEARVASGEYASAEDVIRTAIQPWLERERDRMARLDSIRQKIAEGLDSPTVRRDDAQRRLELRAEKLGLPYAPHAT